MPKLLTPVQYEPALDGLNEVRPLQLADEVKIALNIPVFNVNPVGKNKPVVGKLARCNQQGALLESNKVFDLRNFEYQVKYTPFESGEFSVTFAQPIKGFLVYFYARSDESHNSVWVTPDGIVIKRFIYQQYMWFDFKGTILVHWFVGPPGSRATEFWGFY